MHSNYPANASAIVWFTGLSGAGKTTLCRAAADVLRSRGTVVQVLDGDEMRRTFCADLGFSREDREENVRRIASIAEKLAVDDIIVLVAAISPYRAMRDELRERLGNLVEVYVNAPLETCIQRDPKGLYRRALANEIDAFTGISDPYEPPLAPDIECHTGVESVDASTAKLLAALDRIFALRESFTHAAR